MYKGLSSEEVKERIEKGQVNLDSSVKKLAFWAPVSHDMLLIEELTSDIFAVKSAEVKCHARTGVASVQTQ